MFKVGDKVVWLGNHTWPLYTALTITEYSFSSNSIHHYKHCFKVKEQASTWYTRDCFMLESEFNFKNKLAKLVDE